jgi:hypothetical protein
MINLIVIHYFDAMPKEETMSIINQAMLVNIQKFSETLSEGQLNNFLDIVDSLGELLVLANQDTEKAYQMYLNSIETKVSEHVSNSNPMVNVNVQSLANNVVQFKH